MGRKKTGKKKQLTTGMLNLKKRVRGRKRGEKANMNYID